MRRVFSGGGSVTGGCNSIGGGASETTFSFQIVGHEFEGNCSMGGGNAEMSKPPGFATHICSVCGDPYANLGRCACNGNRQPCPGCGMVITPGTPHAGCRASYLACSAEPAPAAAPGSPTPLIRFGELVGEALDRLMAEREAAAFQRGYAAGLLAKNIP